MATQTTTLDDFDTYYPNYTQASTDVLPSNSYEPYMPVVDPSPPPGSVPTSIVNPSTTQTTVLDDFNTYYPDYTQAPTDVLPSNSQPSYDLLSTFGYQQTSTLQQQQQQDSFANNFVFPATSVNESMYDAPSPYLLPSTATETTIRQSIPIMSPSLANNLTSLPPPVTAPPPKAKTDNTVTSPAPKTKPEKTKFFTLKRQKAKPEPEKRSSLVETVSEVSS